MSDFDDYEIVSSATGYDRVFVRKRDGTEGVGWLQFLGGALFCWTCTYGLYAYIGAATPLTKIALVAVGIVSFGVGMFVFLRLMVVVAVFVVCAVIAAIVYGVWKWVFSTPHESVRETYNVPAYGQIKQNQIPQHSQADAKRSHNLYFYNLEIPFPCQKTQS